jgi:hypothetical protein
MVLPPYPRWRTRTANAIRLFKSQVEGDTYMEDVCILKDFSEFQPGKNQPALFSGIDMSTLVVTLKERSGGLAMPQKKSPARTTHFP